MRYRIYDSDAHVILTERQWQDLPSEYHARRPRAAQIRETDGLGGFTTLWFVEGRLAPHPWGPGSQPGNIPVGTYEAFPGTPPAFAVSEGSQDLSDPAARLHDLDRLGIEVSVIFPTTLYAAMTSDPGLEGALYRSYNRYVGKACQANPKRLKWVGLVPLRDPRNACEALREMQSLGASGAVVYGTVGERLLSDALFYPFFDEFCRWGTPLCVHFGQSYSPLEPLTRTMLAGNIIGMSLPAFLAFYAVTCGGLLDRYPKMKVGFFEFGSEWILYIVARIDKYRDMAVSNAAPYNTDVGKKRALEYVRSANIFLSGEAEDRVLPQEIELLGEDQFLYASDFPHPEERDAGSNEIVKRNDLTETQKRKILWDNAIRFWGEP